MNEILDRGRVFPTHVDEVLGRNQSFRTADYLLRSIIFLGDIVCRLSERQESTQVFFWLELKPTRLPRTEISDMATFAEAQACPAIFMIYPEENAHLFWRGNYQLQRQLGIPEMLQQELHTHLKVARDYSILAAESAPLYLRENRGKYYRAFLYIAASNQSAVVDHPLSENRPSENNREASI